MDLFLCWQGGFLFVMHMGAPLLTFLHRLAPRPFLLFSHFFSVAFYSLWVMFTHARPVMVDADDGVSFQNGHVNGHSNGKANGYANGHTNGHANGHSNGHANGHSKPSSKRVVMLKPSILEYPAIFIRCFAVVSHCTMSCD